MIINILPVYLNYSFESLNIFIFYPFLSFLLLHYKVISNISDAGYYIGGFSASYALGQLFGNRVWGVVSDKIGRKKLFLFSIIIYIFSFLLFGLSINIYMAFLARFIAGLLCSNMMNTRVYLSDISNNNNSSTYFGALSYFWYFGSISGSLIGGYLYNYYFEQFPALFSCLITIAILILIFTTNLIFLSESKNNTIDICELCEICNATENNTQDNTQDNIQQNIGIKYIYDNISIRYAVLTYVVFIFVDYSISEAMPLLLVMPKKYGGFEYDSSLIGVVFMISSAVAFVLQPIFILLDNKMKIKRKYIISFAFIFISLLSFFIPFIPRITDDKYGKIILVIACLSLRNCVTSWCYNLTSMFISNVSDLQFIGQIFGIAQSIISIFGIICPIAFSTLFSYTATSQHLLILFDQHFIFNIFALIIILPFIFVRFIESEKIERIEKNENIN
jgi:MFS family permease